MDGGRRRFEQEIQQQITEKRERMLKRHLKSRGIHDARVLKAMADVPREEFVPREMVDEAYDDWPLPIGWMQTISQPYTVAFMLQLLELDGTEQALEIGTGSGYAAAVMSRLVRTVHTVERIPALAESARDRLSELGFDNVCVHLGDGSCGLPEHAPYDAIVVTAGGQELPDPFRDQLAEGGRIVIPMGRSRQRQALYRFRKHEGQIKGEILGHFAFVPLIGEHAWDDR